MITKDVIMYKTYLKNHQETSIKLRIIKHKIADNLQIKDIVFKYSMHRNTVRNILKLYNSKASTELKSMIENNVSLSLADIEKYCNFLLPKSTRPKSHSKQASISQENQIIEYYNKTKI